MRRLRVAIVLGATLILALGLTPSLVGGMAGASGDGPAPLTFQVLATSVQFTEIDVDGQGFPSQGDKFVYENVLTKDGVEVGFDGEVCTFTRLVSPEDLTVQCFATFRFPEGQIATQALITAADVPQMELTVVGGTRAYSGVTGYAILDVINEDQGFYTFFLDYHPRKAPPQP